MSEAPKSTRRAREAVPYRRNQLIFASGRARVRIWQIRVIGRIRSVLSSKR